ncbi:11807_t:CDS:10 [Ambispora leptoticha]|uniref:11807_t:CDS:1 n=1 Tax=Ambispora leptoticha TaxID=144679 RepID=A0A9N8VU50_9GLOM|nr:11807_t:CDS:10 [Ambispora leptoticha]
MTSPGFENNFDDLLDQPPVNTISETLTDVDVSNPFQDAISPLRPASAASNYHENSESSQSSTKNNATANSNSQKQTSIPNPLEHILNEESTSTVSPVITVYRDGFGNSATPASVSSRSLYEHRDLEDVDVSSVTAISIPYDSRSESDDGESNSFDEENFNGGAPIEYPNFTTAHHQSENQYRDQASAPKFEISVEDPQQIGDTFTGYILYNVRTRTTSTKFKSQDFTVRRRYRDFLWLYNQLTLNKPGVIVPPVPEKHIYVLASARFQHEFVENRRQALEKCLNKITSHPELQDDPDLHLFLESDTFTTDVKRNESKGVLRSLSDAMSNAATFSKFTETDEWFENRRNQLDILESQLKALLNGATKEFGESMMTLACAEYEKNDTVARNLTTLGNLQLKIRELHEIQAQKDVVALENTVEEYIRLIGSIKVAFNSRAKCYQTWQNVHYELQKKKVTYDRFKSQGKLRHERLSLMLTDIAETERKGEDCRHEFERVTKLIKAEIDRFDKEKVEDFKNSLENYLESMVQTQKQIIALWESYFKEIEMEKRSSEQIAVSAN